MNLLKSVASKSAVSKPLAAGRLNRRTSGIMLGALVLCSIVVVEPAVAQPTTKHGYSSDRAAQRASLPDARRGDRDGGRAVQAPRFSPPAPVASRPRDRVNPAYRFRADDRARLQRYYHGSFDTVRVDRRPYFRAGRTIPGAYRSHIAVVPLQMRRHLPPPPHGYRLGYYQGYSVVYDPVTFTILSVLDLLAH